MSKPVRFEQLFQQHFAFVWRCLRGHGVQPADVDDLVQEVFMVVHRRLDEIQLERDIRSWIYGVLKFVLTNYRRGNRRAQARHRAFEHEPLPTTSHESSPAVALQQKDAAHLVSSILQRLEPPRREVLMLVELEEFAVSEAARALNIPLNTAYSRLRLARADFKAELARSTNDG